MSKDTILPSRKPEPYVKASCTHCSSQLELLPPSNLLLQKANVKVRCWSCQQVCQVDLAKIDTAKADNKSSQSSSSNSSKKEAKGDSKKDSRRIGTDQNPLSTEYYDLLGVSPTADEAEIKKKYRALAIKYHPDKNKDPDAEEVFKRISEAYQVLSDPDLRHKYNEFGKQNDLTPEGGFVNPEDFFKQQFGGDRFLDIIGEISIGRDMKEALQEGGDNDAESISEEEKKRREKENEKERQEMRDKRVNKLAENLKRKLTVFVEGPATPEAEVAFEKMIEIEAEELKTESYGVELLHAIGFTYTLKAKQALSSQGLGLKRFYYSFKEKSHIFGETFSTLRCAIDLQNSFAQLQEAEKKGIEGEAKNKLEEDAASKGLKALWLGSKLEVEGVLRDVCDQVLFDTSVPAEVLQRRALGLRIVGAVYERVKADIDTEPPNHNNSP
ncbi:uncharacterized protein VTP21DRAFT_4251 [Calcarisporiella thermophila]|uniref:uncharacterized protein n=1 Tax=Calcarisporiella thermophila TaxID=911321 RepID=UPI0037422AB7